MQRSEVYRGFECGEDVRRDALVLAEMRAAVHHAVADGYWRRLRVIAESGEDRGEGFRLRLEDVIAAEEIVAGGVLDVQRAGRAADAVGAAFEEELFVCATLRAARIKPELERRRAAVKDEDGSFSHGLRLGV
jgi:hypothetical protein